MSASQKQCEIERKTIENLKAESAVIKKKIGRFDTEQEDKPIEMPKIWR